MSKFYIQEGNSTGTGRKYFQVFIGNKAVGNPCLTRDEAEGLIELFEQREAEALAEREAELEKPQKSAGPSFGM